MFIRLNNNVIYIELKRNSVTFNDNSYFDNQMVLLILNMNKKMCTARRSQKVYKPHYFLTTKLHFFR